MYLCSYLINGSDKAGIDIASPTPGDLNGHFPFVVSSSVPQDYVNISSIENWNSFGLSAVDYGGSGVVKDYKFVRNEIKQLYLATSWSALTNSEKQITSKFFISSYANRAELYSMSQMIALGLDHHKNSIYARQVRLLVGSTTAFNFLGETEIVELRRDVLGLTGGVHSHDLITAYVQYGQEGTLEDGSEGLFDYLEGRVGTSYEASGFCCKNWNPAGGLNMMQLTASIMQILKTGIY